MALPAIASLGTCSLKYGSILIGVGLGPEEAFDGFPFIPAELLEGFFGDGFGEAHFHEFLDLLLADDGGVFGVSLGPGPRNSREGSTERWFRTFSC